LETINIGDLCAFEVSGRYTLGMIDRCYSGFDGTSRYIIRWFVSRRDILDNVSESEARFFKKYLKEKINE
jgi:hypothetical protein